MPPIERETIMELWPFFDAAVKYLIVPGIVWIFALHRAQNLLQTEVAVIKAEAVARDIARREERAATTKQLDQILNMLQALSVRVDSAIKEK